jgi:hypothetical protein
LGLPSGLFPSGFPTSNLYSLFASPYVLHAPPISLKPFGYVNEIKEGGLYRKQNLRSVF